MCTEIYADELEKDIMLMNQELTVKRGLLNECRQKLHSEILQHAETKSNASRYLNQNKDLQTQLEMSLAATKTLEEELNNTREATAKLQVQVEVYLNERQLLIDRCYQVEASNDKLKTEIIDLQEQMKGHVAFQESYKERQLQTSKIVDEILSKQEILNKEQKRLEIVCKEGLKFAAKVSEDAKFQAEFAKAAEASQRKVEQEIIGLMALRELKERKQGREKDVCLQESCNYLQEWKTSQQEMQMRIQDLQEENKRLGEELTFATSQLEILTKKSFSA